MTERRDSPSSAEQWTEADALYESHYLTPEESYLNNYAAMTSLARKWELRARAALQAAPSATAPIDPSLQDASPGAVRYARVPQLDKRIANGDDFAGDAWVRWTAVGHAPFHGVPAVVESRKAILDPSVYDETDQHRPQHGGRPMTLHEIADAEAPRVALAPTEGQLVDALRPVVSDIFDRFGSLSRGQALQMLVDAARSMNASAASKEKP